MYMKVRLLVSLTLLVFPASALASTHPVIPSGNSGANEYIETLPNASGQGRAEFWLDTGHSIHNERPRLFAREIISFLTNLGSGSSPNGTVVSTPPKAAYSMRDR